jgi:hypothetical protein
MSTITPPTLLITIALVFLIFAVSRQHLLAPFVIAACFVPAEQNAYILGLHFYVLRILILAGVLRIFLMNEYRPIKWSVFDKLVYAWALCGAVIYFLLRLDMGAVIYKSGVLMDVLGMYWITRQAIRSWDDLKDVCGLFAMCAIVLVPFVALEWSTGSNPFHVLGRVYTAIRLGEFRCQASFPHAIIFGTFWVCLVPLFVAMAMTSSHRVLYGSAVAACVFMAAASNSSTPVGGLGAVLAFLAVFRWRRYGRHMAIAFFGTLTALHLSMKAPVWHLLSRVRIIGGSTGYHRYKLIDETVKNFRDWALLGTLNTEKWAWHLSDVTNQFALEGIRGGFLTLVLFVAIVFVAIRTTGWYSRRSVPRDQQWLAWALCVSIIGHCIMFIGVAYFGQIQMLLYMTFAIVGFVYDQNTQLVAAEARVRAQPVHARRVAPGTPELIS